MTDTQNAINVQLNNNGEILVNGKAVANLEAVQALITENATKPEVPMLVIQGAPECAIEVGKLISGAHWAGYPSEKIEARAW